MFLCFPAGAVVSSKGERGKPSRGTSERRGWRELETLWSLSSFKWKQLHRPPASYLFPASPSPLYSSHLISPVTLYLPPRALSFSFSVLPGYWRVKGILQSYWLHNRLLIPLSTKNKRTCITTGGLRKSKKAVTMKLEYVAWIWKDTVWNSQLLIRGNHSSGSSERNLLIRKLFSFFFSSFGVFWDQGKEEKVNYADVKYERHRKHFIYETEFGGFLCFLFFFFFFFL